MHDNRSRGVMPLSIRGGMPLPAVDHVCGLGVCDVLRVEIERCQVPLLRSEVDELRLVYEDTLCGDERDLDRLTYEREVLDVIDAQVNGSGGERVVMYGPARLVSEIVAGATGEAAQRLAERVTIDAARVAMAWAETSAATRAIESYSFDSSFDHVRQW